MIIAHIPHGFLLRCWLAEHPTVLASVVFRFLRLIQEHWKKFDELHREEIHFVIHLLDRYVGPGEPPLFEDPINR